MCTLPFWVGRRMLQAKMEAIVVCLFEQRKEKTTFHDKFFGFVVGVPSKFKIIFKKKHFMLWFSFYSQTTLL
jgi:hypothetical protein